MVTLVLLPGMDGTGALFGPFVAALGSVCKVTIVGYPTQEALDYVELESIARAALPLEGPYIILGESFSGPIAVSIAASCPDRLIGLVLCGSFIRNPRPFGTLFKPFIGLVPIVGVPVSMLSWLLLGRFSTVSFRDALMQALKRVAPSVLRARLLAVLSVDVSAKLAEVCVPVLYLRASHDRLVPHSAAKLVSQFCPHAKVVSIDAPHFLLQAAATEAAREVVAFVRADGPSEAKDC